MAIEMDHDEATLTMGNVNFEKCSISSSGVSSRRNSLPSYSGGALYINAK